MGPLIDTELEKVDRKHLELSELNRQVVSSLEMYNTLMRELPGYGYSGIPKMAPPVQYNMQQPPQSLQVCINKYSCDDTCRCVQVLTSKYKCVLINLGVY